MTRVDLLFRNIDWLITVDGGRRILRDGAIAVTGGKIVAVGKTDDLAKAYLGDKEVSGRDMVVPPEAQAQIVDGLKGNSNVTLHSYADMEHAFARTGGQHYDKANADLANKRTEDFFRKTLG